MADSLSQQHPELEGVWRMLFRRPLTLQRESAFFLMVSVLDVVMTYLLLTFASDGRARFYESNPVARFFFDRWDVWGIVYFKFANVALVEVIAHVVATKNVVVARRLLDFGTLVVSTVVIYSMLLLVWHQ